MLCITGNESSLEQLQTRIESTSAELHARGLPFLQEVRIDCLEQINDDTFQLLALHASHILACCRPKEQGGLFQGWEADRIRLLQRAARAGVAIVDVEHSVSDSALQSVREALTGRLLLSFHDFKHAPENALALIDDMNQRQADLIKVAFPVDDASELAVLLDLSRRAKAAFVGIGMGFAGLLSRLRYRSFGSTHTYVSATSASRTAPGQLTIEQALAYGLPEAAEHPFLALVGGPQIVHSPGPATYNRLFRSTGRPYSYIPVVTSRPIDTFALLQRCGAIGASVTMPHKAQALAWASADQLAIDAQAANTLRFDDSGAHATNTDRVGVFTPLANALRALDLIAPDVLILGAGGAARAALLASLELGARVTMAVRSPDSVAPSIAKLATIVPWTERGQVHADVLINATPVVGTDTSPWPSHLPLHKKLVFDLALGDSPSALLNQAQQEGASVLTALDMWLSQGAAQLSFMLDTTISPFHLREMLPCP